MSGLPEKMEVDGKYDCYDFTLVINAILDYLKDYISKEEVERDYILKSEVDIAHSNEYTSKEALAKYYFPKTECDKCGVEKIEKFLITTFPKKTCREIISEISHLKEIASDWNLKNDTSWQDGITVNHKEGEEIVVTVNDKPKDICEHEYPTAKEWHESGKLGCKKCNKPMLSKDGGEIWVSVGGVNKPPSVVPIPFMLSPEKDDINLHNEFVFAINSLIDKITEMDMRIGELGK